MDKIKYFLRTDNENFIFPIFSREHLIFLAIAFFIGALLIIFGNKISNSKYKKVLRYGILGILIFYRIVRVIYYTSSGLYTIREYLPLHMCQIASLALMVALYNKNERAFTIAYFYGFIGGIVAILTPDTGKQAFPHISIVLFFMLHVFMNYGVLYLLFVEKMRPSFQGYKFMLKFSLIYAGIIIIFNSIVGSNYLYLRNKPVSGSILDFLPPYPYYVPFAVLLFLFYLTLAYIPFFLSDKAEKGIKTISID